MKYATPEGGHPDDILSVVAQILEDLEASALEHLGVCVPSVVTHGMTRSAANISPDWIDFAAEETFSTSLNHTTHFINDADAAGFAEARLGAARGIPGMTILTTLGTGIGSALLVDGDLIPHSELGHLELEGTDVEHRMSNAAREREGLSFEVWGERLTSFYAHLEVVAQADGAGHAGALCARLTQLKPRWRAPGDRFLGVRVCPCTRLQRAQCCCVTAHA